MHWLEAWDVGLLRFINQTWSNPFFDFVMPIASGKIVRPFLLPVVFLIGALLLWKGGARGRLCVLMLALIVAPGDALVCNLIKHAVARPRPYLTHPDVRRPGDTNYAATAPSQTPSTEMGAGSPRVPSGHNSMPSSHAANWFSATMILFVYYRRSWRFMLPLACLVAYSRVYLGVHYPSDVLAGAILGAGYAVATMWLLDALWQWSGRKWFRPQWETVPTLVMPEGRR